MGDLEFYTTCASGVILAYRLFFGILELAIWYLWPLSDINNMTGLSDSEEDRPSSKATVVCATQNQSASLLLAIATWCANKPASIIIVADPASFLYIRNQVSDLNSEIHIQVFKAPKAHKREQLCIGFQKAQTSVIVICDDDTRWTPTVLENLVTPLLRNPALGCVFPDLRVDPVGQKFTVWELLGLWRLVGDGVDFHASRQIDGGVFCHHGSTAAYQSIILKDPKFVQAFTNETWRGHVLNSGDDQFLCCWLTNHNWPTCLLSADRCLVQTRMRDSWRHMLQLLRWSRNDWRRCLSTLIFERHIWRRNPLTAWLRVVWCLRAFAPIIESTQLYFNWSFSTFCLIMASRMFRYLPHIIQNPGQVWLIPFFLMHLYAHTFLKIFALFTLTNTDWL